ncbi:MAG TPA: hypothetical protein VJ846_00095 [Sphingomicrobium sp.]|nr:hypothetical protein [Sphingomicrobium sp.]
MPLTDEQAPELGRELYGLSAGDADWAADDELLISLGRIAFKRSMELAKDGEVNAGPEECRRCGADNPAWNAPSPLWNAVMRGGSINGDPLFDDMVCATCFMYRCDMACRCRARKRAPRNGDAIGAGLGP